MRRRRRRKYRIIESEEEEEEEKEEEKEEEERQAVATKTADEATQKDPLPQEVVLRPEAARRKQIRKKHKSKLSDLEVIPLLLLLEIP